MALKYYSARLLFVILIDDGKPHSRHDYDESVIVFRARGWKSAFGRALRIGRSMQSQYRNYRKQVVRWALVRVETLDLVGDAVDGKEVSSRLHTRVERRPIAAKSRFHPEKSRPGQSF